MLILTSEMPKTYRLANHRLRKDREYVPPVDGGGPLFSVSYRPNTIILTVSDAHVDFLSDESLATLRKNCTCADCGKKPRANLEECPCQSVKRLERISALAQILGFHASDRDALNALLKAFFRERTSERRARKVLAAESEPRQRFGGSYSLNVRKQWVVYALLGEDERYRLDHFRRLTRVKRLRHGGGSHSEEDIKALLNIQQRRCYFCCSSLLGSGDVKAFSRDHLQPISRGGSDGLMNIALVCRKCNSSKHMKTESEFWAYLRKQEHEDKYREARAQARRVAAERLRAFPR